MPRALGGVVQQLERGETPAAEAIETLLAGELGWREGRRVKAAPRMARLGAVKTLGSFDFSFQPSLDRGRVQALAQLGSVGRREVLHLPGPPGAGKSRLAAALGVEAIRAGRSVYLMALADLAAALARAERDGSVRERLRFLCRPQLLIADEIGYLPVVPGGGNSFFQLANARRERGAMLLASNRGFAERGEVFGDPVVAAALLDRLLHHATVVQIEGNSHRMRQHASRVPEAMRPRSAAPPPPPGKRRGRPPKDRSDDQISGRSPSEPGEISTGRFEEHSGSPALPVLSLRVWMST